MLLIRMTRDVRYSSDLPRRISAGHLCLSVCLSAPLSVCRTPCLRAVVIFSVDKRFQLKVLRSHSGTQGPVFGGIISSLIGQALGEGGHVIVMC